MAGQPLRGRRSLRAMFRASEDRYTRGNAERAAHYHKRNSRAATRASIGCLERRQVSREPLGVGISRARGGGGNWVSKGVILEARSRRKPKVRVQGGETQWSDRWIF